MSSLEDFKRVRSNLAKELPMSSIHFVTLFNDNVTVLKHHCEKQKGWKTLKKMKIYYGVLKKKIYKMSKGNSFIIKDTLQF